MSEEEQAPAGLNDLVVIGSSAGGIEALSILVSTLPTNFPAPIVLAQHLDPTRPSSLDSILQRRTSLPVILVSTSATLEAGKIYMVPSNRHVMIRDHTVAVEDDSLKRPRPSVDRLLSSAAEAYGEHLIAVILTGSGSDGAAGAIDVKNAGGSVVIQSPQTARYPSMPLALPPSVVDFEADLEQMGSLLTNLAMGVGLPALEEKTEDILHKILVHVSRQTSMDFRAYKNSTILRRIGRRMTMTHNRSMSEYAQYLEEHSEEVGELVKAFLINVTQFFRDTNAFAYLKDETLPKLIARTRERDRVLRFWAAGCSTGEEAYSLAMLLTDLLGTELSEWSIKIFATDIDGASINFARRGLYSETLLKGVPAEYVGRFFERADHGYRISKALRQMVIFGQQDLMRSAPFPHIDMVFCRNLLIYFTAELQDYVLNQFAFSLFPDGYLFLGKAETVRPLQTYYELVNKHWKVYRCMNNPLPAMRRPGFQEMRSPYAKDYASIRSKRLGGRAVSEQDAGTQPFEIGQLRRLNELLLRFLPVGVLVIDHNYRILTANGFARRLLGLRDLGGEQDFFHSVRGIPYSQVRAAIDTVFRERTTVTLPDVEFDVVLGGSSRLVSLSIALMQAEAGLPDMATISVTDVTEQVQMRRQLEVTQTEQAQLMNELSAANKRLNDMNKELLDANEELQVANEELLVTHEELQATIEEFETTNEELQATNEELETNNEELQATNEELETTNEEMRARTSELQELTVLLETEQAQLSEMVELAPFAIIVLRGPQLLVEAFNPRYGRQLSERAIVGRPLAEISDLFWDSGETLVRLAREVYAQNSIRTTTRLLSYVQNASSSSILPVTSELAKNYYIYTLVPSHNAGGRVSGVLIYAIDETEQRAHELLEEREQLKLIFENAVGAALALYDAETATLIMGSPSYLAMAGHTHSLPGSDLIGQSWSDLTFISSAGEATQIWKTLLESHQAVHLAEVPWPTAPVPPVSIWDWNITPIMDSVNEEQVRFVLISAVEITEQVHARQEIEHLNQIKEDFLSLAGHELRTPLTSIAGNSQLLQRSLQSKGRATKQEQVFEREGMLLERIMEQVGRMNILIEEMLDVARIRGNALEIQRQVGVDLLALVEQILVAQRAITDHQIVLQTTEQSIEGNFDAGHLQQVLLNLLENAVKYSPSGSLITVSLERQDGDPATPEENVLLSIQDQGQGVSEEAQKHIFERFYRGEATRTDVSGLGLGLYITYEIVKEMGGTTWLVSKPGDGSTFYVSLPLRPLEER